MQEGKELTKAFGRGIAQRRGKLGYSQETLAEKVGIRQESLSRIEKGVIAPKFERLQAFADALDCSVMGLFRFDDRTEGNAMADTIADIIVALPVEKHAALVEFVRQGALLARKHKD